MSLSLKNDILNAVRGGYQPIGDPSTKSVNWPKSTITGSNAHKPNPYYIPPASKNKDEVVLTYDEYRKLLVRICVIEDKIKQLRKTNCKLNSCCKLNCKSIVKSK